MSEAAAILKAMDGLSVVVGVGLGVLFGLVIGYLIAKARSAKSSDLAPDLAAAKATETELRAQLEHLKTQISSDKQKADEENKILVQLAPVKQQLEQMQSVVSQLEKERSTQFASITEQLRNAVETDENLRKQTALIG